MVIAFCWFSHNSLLHGSFFLCLCCNGAAKIEINLIGWCLLTSAYFLGWDHRRRRCCWVLKGKKKWKESSKPILLVGGRFCFGGELFVGRICVSYVVRWGDGSLQREWGAEWCQPVFFCILLSACSKGWSFCAFFSYTVCPEAILVCFKCRWVGFFFGKDALHRVVCVMFSEMSLAVPKRCSLLAVGCFWPLACRRKSSVCCQQPWSRLEHFSNTDVFRLRQKVVALC